MATKTPLKQPVEPIVEAKPTLNESVDVALLNLEDAIADQLLDSLDWQKVKAAMLTKVKQRFVDWLTSGSDRPVNISPFPELYQLPSHDDERAA